ncbi:Unknown protein [Striga hermonthica]|uniref:Uncharacterized protein n=1 Tax=Striga hermonthica TaxID=68872 RepID=A0A9N7R9G9_STRHE|nr:Unknown protein [Striga hermonthica]
MIHYRLEANVQSHHAGSVKPRAHKPSASNTTIKKRRGQTMGKGIMKAFQACGKKMKVTVDPSIGRPKSRDESSKFSSQIGVVTRDVLPVPVRWKDVDEEKDLQPGIDHIKIHMDINLDDPGVKRCVIDKVQASSRQKRYRLHKHYKKYSSHEEAKNNKPSFCASQENWEDMCELFASPKFKVMHY